MRFEFRNVCWSTMVLGRLGAGEAHGWSEYVP